jgi:diadenosine tetraphosphate (Ap4A) HIT family hydrolase
MCNFCELTEKEKVLSTEYFFAILDRAPVTKGHALIILKDHKETPFLLTEAEWREVPIALEKIKEYIEKSCNPDGYNIGINSGKAAGQTVPHLHIHVIPRYKGDMENPRGGVRNLMKPLEELWPE